MVGNPFSPKELMDLSSELGSDCPLFLAGGASIMRGRGDQIQPLNMHQAQRLKSQNVMLLLPSIHVSTPWAYNEFSRKRDHESSEELSSPHSIATSLAIVRLEKPSIMTFPLSWSLNLLLLQLPDVYSKMPK